MADGWGTDDGGWGAGDSNDAPASGGARDSGCRICKEDGHFARDCPKKGEQGERKKGCFKCGEEGHNKADCPKADDDDEPREKKGCFKCKGDHMAKDCDQPDKCRMCGEEGHMSKECPGAKTHSIEVDGVKKEIYIPTEMSDADLFTQGISTGINFEKFDKIPVTCSGENVPKPVATFDAMGLRGILVENVKKSGYVKPTPIQKTAIPCIMADRDLMGCAQTGSGKTAAFVLPILHRLLEQDCQPNAGDCPQQPQAVIIAPTRELAVQIKDETRKFAAGSVLKSVVVYGGTSSGFQLSTLFKGCNVLICTPGRLMDFVEKGKISFESLKFLVLDEADRMLDMGFLPDITRVVNHSSMPAKGTRRTLMFSATFPEEVQHLAADFLDNYLFLAIGIVGGANTDVKQAFFQVEKFKKRDKLVEILRDVGTERTLVFVEQKKNADFLATFLSSEGLPTTSIHGDRMQSERETALADFKSGHRNILIATDVAARGLDIKGVAHVINYDLPKEIDSYVHRIGRTGRVGNVGKATSFVDPEEKGEIVPSIVKILTECQQEVPDFMLGMGAAGDFNSGAGFGGVDIRGGPATQANAADEEW